MFKKTKYWLAKKLVPELFKTSPVTITQETVRFERFRYSFDFPRDVAADWPEEEYYKFMKSELASAIPNEFFTLHLADSQRKFGWGVATLELQVVKPRR